MADHDTHDHTGVPGVGTGDITDPMTTRGDIIIRNASNVTARLGRGTAGQVLTSDGTDIDWDDPGGGVIVQEEGTPLSTTGTTLNFTGAGVTASGTGATKTINVPGSSGGVTGALAVQNKAFAGGSSGTRAVTMGSTPTNGNMLFAFVAILGGTQTVSSIASTNTTWTKLDDSGASAPRVEIWKGVVAASAGTTITATFSATVADSMLAVIEMPASLGLAGTLASSGKRNATAHGGGNDALCSAPAILPLADEIVLTGISCGNGTLRFGGIEGGPFVIPEEVLVPGSYRGYMVCAYGFPGNVPVAPASWGGTQTGGVTFSALVISVT